MEGGEKMVSDVERNVNMLFKTADLQIKTVTTVMSVVKDLFEYLSKDNDVRMLKKELNEKNRELQFFVCKPEYMKDLATRLEQIGIPHVVSASASLDGAGIILFSSKHREEIEKILAEFRAEHSRGGLTTKDVVCGKAENGTAQIEHLDHYEAAIMIEQAKAQGINVALDSNGKDDFNIIFDQNDKAVMDNIRMTTAIQKCSGPAYEALKKQIDYEDAVSMEQAKDAASYNKNQAYYLTDINGTVMRVTADKVTYQEKGGKEIIIDSDDFQRDSKIMSLVGAMNCPTKLTEEDYSKYEKLSEKEKKDYLIAVDKENGRPQLSQAEYEAIRKMEDSRILYEQKLAQDNPEQEIYQYSYLNNEMRMETFAEFEKINQEAVHDRPALDNSDIELLDDARSQYRGYAEKQSELSYEQQEYADAVLENDFDRLEKEFDMDDRWQKVINDRNANFIPDDLEDPESLDSFKD